MNPNHDPIVWKCSRCMFLFTLNVLALQILVIRLREAME